MKAIREFYEVAAANSRLILIYAVFIPIILLGSVMMNVSSFTFYKVEYSRSDLILLSMMGSFILIVFAVAVLYFIMFLLRYDFMTAVVIRQRGKRSIWFRQAVKVAVFSFFVSLYSTFLLLLFSPMFSSVDNNWDSYKSAFFDTMRFELDHAVSLPVVALLFFVFMFFFLLTMTLLYLLVKWNFHSEVIGCIAVIVYLLYCRTDYTFFNYMATCAIQYNHFANPADLLTPLLAPLLWIGVLLGAGALLANRAEFYTAGKK